MQLKVDFIYLTNKSKPPLSLIGESISDNVTIQHVQCYITVILSLTALAVIRYLVVDVS